MAAFALCFMGIFGASTRASQNVYTMGHGIKMLGVDAPSVSAKMIDGQTGRDCPAV